MAEYTRIQNNFAAGILDPILHGQINSEMYQAGLQECFNMIPSSLGYVYRRTGTKYIGMKVDASRVRLTAIRTNEGPLDIIIMEGRILCFSEKNNLKLELKHNSSDNDIPWAGTDLEFLNIAELEGNLYIVHPDYPPHILHALNSGISRIRAIQVAVAPYAAVQIASTIKLSKVKAIGDVSCKAVEWAEKSTVKFDGQGMYPSCQTFKGSRWYLSGCKNSPSTIYASRTVNADGSYRFNDFYMGSIILKKVTASITKTIKYEDTTHSAIESVSYDSDSSTEEIILESDDYEHPTDSRTLTSIKYYDGATEVNIELPFDKKVEVTSVESYNIQSDLYDDNAIEITESDMFGSAIVWLLTQQRVIAGAQRSIWMDSGEIATPTTFDMMQTLGASCSSIQPTIWGSLVIFVTADRRGIKGFYYDDNASGYKLMDISSHAKTLFVSDIKDIKVVEAEDSILWVLLEDGTLLSCTLGNFFAWARHKIGGNAEVISIYPYVDDKGKGTLYIAVARSMRGFISIESLSLDNVTDRAAIDYIDGAFKYETLENFDDNPFINDEKILLVNGNNQFDEIIYQSDSFENKYKEYQSRSAGYPIEAGVEFLWQELPAQTAQSSLGFNRKVNSSMLQLYRSRCGIIGYISDGMEHIRRLAQDGNVTLVKSEKKNDYFGFEIEVEDSYDYYTGLIKIPAPSYTSDTIRSFIKVDKPHPLTLQAIETRYIIQEV